MLLTALRYGILSGLLMFVCSVAWLMLLAFAWASPTDFDDPIVGAIGLVPVFFGIRHYRDHVAGGVLTFRAAIDSGVLIAFIAGTTTALIWQAHLSFNNRTYLDDYMDAVRAQMIATHAKPRDIFNFVEELDEESFHSRPLDQRILNVLVWTFGMGVPASVVSASVLMRKTPSSS
jgi:hypothetical protein